MDYVFPRSKSPIQVLEYNLNYELTVNDFSVSEQFKKTFGDKIDHLLEVAPSDSGIISNITKTITGYLGKLEIMTSQGEFAVSNAGLELEDTVKGLFSQMHAQMKNWRTDRIF